MYNDELYAELEKDFGKDEMVTFSLIVSAMYHIIYKNRTRGVINESSYERDWWAGKFKELMEKRNQNEKQRAIKEPS